MAAVSGDDFDEGIYDEDIVYEINSFGVDFLVDGLVRRLEENDIYRPDFQRNFVWTQPQASRFIESVLLGLPIPGVFLYRDEDTRRHLIIDGLQRLTTLQAFAKGELPNTDRRFRLKNVKERFEGRAIDDLDAADRRRFFDASIHATVIQQAHPQEDQSAVFHIFERLNTGGTPLQPQEMRAAIYNGPFQKLLENLNDYQPWREIFGPVNKRAKDQELILRFLALYFYDENYREPMKGFLNQFMSRHRYLDEQEARKFEHIFFYACDLAIKLFGPKPFRPARSLNVAVFDACMVALAKVRPADAQSAQKAYQELLNHEGFVAATSKSTASEANVRTRIHLAIDHFS